jgi:hypothetical protein
LRRIRKSRGHYVVPRNNITLHNTTLTGVPLQQNGDFVIDDVLTPVPSTCASPVLLIRNVAGTWFAAGIPMVENHPNR